MGEDIVSLIKYQHTPSKMPEDNRHNIGPESAYTILLCRISDYANLREICNSLGITGSVIVSTPPGDVRSTSEAESEPPAIDECKFEHIELELLTSRAINNKISFLRIFDCISTSASAATELLSNFFPRLLGGGEYIFAFYEQKVNKGQAGPRPLADFQFELIRFLMKDSLAEKRFSNAEWIKYLHAIEVKSVGLTLRSAQELLSPNHSQGAHHGVNSILRDQNEEIKRLFSQYCKCYSRLMETEFELARCTRALKTLSERLKWNRKALRHQRDIALRSRLAAERLMSEAARLVSLP